MQGYQSGRHSDPSAFGDGNLNLDVGVVNWIDSTVLPENMKVTYQKGWDETLFTVYYYRYDDKRRDVDILELGYMHLTVVGQIDDSDPVESRNTRIADPLSDSVG